MPKILVRRDDVANVEDEKKVLVENDETTKKNTQNQQKQPPMPTSGGTSPVGIDEFKCVSGNKFSDALYKISSTGEGLGKMATGSLKNTATMMVRQTGDFGKGYSTMIDVAGVAGLAATAICGIGATSTEALKLSDAGISGRAGVQENLGRIDDKLKNLGFEGVPKDKAGNYITGSQLEKWMSRQKTKMSGLNKEQSAEVSNLMKELKFLGQNTKHFSRKGMFRKNLKVLKKSARRAVGKTGEFGQGLTLTLQLAAVTRIALKANIKATQMSAKAGRIAMKKALKSALNLAIRRSAKVNNFVQSASRTKENVINGVRRGKERVREAVRNRTRPIRNRFERVRNGVRNGVRRGTSFLYRKTIGRTKIPAMARALRRGLVLATAKLRGNIVTRFAVKIMSKMFGFIKSIFSPFFFIKKLLHKIIGCLVGIAGVFLLLYLLIIISVAALGFDVGETTSNSYKAREELNSLYKSDLIWIEQTSRTYSQVEVIWKDVKDYKMYNEMKKENNVDEEEFAFSQSSNCAEILSMAQVKFDYDIDSADWGDVKEYITQLYYGSHRPVIQESSYVQKTKDENGHVEEKNVRSATITMETIYFPQLFECELKDACQNHLSPIKTSDDLLVCSVDDIYIYFRNAGYTHEAVCGILGNMAQESGGQTLDGINPALDTPTALGICSWSQVDSPGRVKALKELAKTTRRDYLSLDLQLDFLQQELDDSYKDVRDKIKNSDDIEYCTITFEKGFEKAGKPNMEARIKCAKDADERYKAYKDDWSKLTNNGKKIAEYAVLFAEKLHYTQGEALGYTGSRYIGPDLSLITTDKVQRKKGTDCSGFIASIHLHYGLSVPTCTSNYEFYSGNEIDIKDIKPGDILWTSGHVELYVGSGSTMGLHDQYCVTEGTGRCEKDSNINPNGLEWFKSKSCKVYRFWK